MSISFRRKLRITFLKWHRGIGLAAAAFVVLLVGTGIALNHGHSLSLDHNPAPRWVLPLYGIELAAPASGFNADGQWLVAAQGQIFFNTLPMGVCQAPLAGAVSVNDMIVAVCQDYLYLFTPGGELVEATTDMPEPPVAIGQQDGKLLIAGQTTTWHFDVDDFVWQKAQQAPTAVMPMALPAPLAQQLLERMTVADITWERLVLDLHSGRLFGELGVWFVDLVAVLLALLAISGVWLRVSRPGGSS